MKLSLFDVRILHVDEDSVNVKVTDGELVGKSTPTTVVLVSENDVIAKNAKHAEQIVIAKNGDKLKDKLDHLLVQVRPFRNE